MNEQNNQEANHQQSTLENSVEAEYIADLPVTAEQAEQAKGGTEFSLNYSKIEFKPR